MDCPVCNRHVWPMASGHFYKPVAAPVGKPMSGLTARRLHARLPDALEDNQSVVRYLIAVLGRAGPHGHCAIIWLMLVTMVQARRGRVISKTASFTNSAAASARQGHLACISAWAADKDSEIVHGVLERTNNQSSLHVDHPHDVYLGIRHG
jgi:hypothetical protein